MINKKTIVNLTLLSLILSLFLSVIGVSASAKLSEYDFKDWNLVAEPIEFTKDDVNYDLDVSMLPIDWSYELAAQGPGNIVEKDGDYLLNMRGFSHVFTTYGLDAKYVFEVEFQCGKGKNVGIFVRASEERFALEANKTDFYEQDRSVKNGNAALGGGGLYIQPNGNDLKLFIKLFDEDEKCFVSKAIYTITTDYDFSAAIHKASFVDDGQSVLIYIQDELIFQVEFSEKTSYSEIGMSEYYSKVVVKDAEGTELGSHDNGLMCTESIVAVGNRNSEITLKSIKLSVDTPPSTPTPEPTDTPEPTPEPTKAPDATNKKDENKEEGKKSIVLPIIIVALVIIALAVVAVIVIKKKK